MYAMLRGLMRLVARVYLVGGLLRLRGRERVPRNGPLILCPNHISTIDPPLVPAFVPRADTWSMAKSDWFLGSAFVRVLFGWYHAFPVVRHTADRRALRRATDILAAGHVLILYPEGTRVTDARLHPPEQGVAFLAMRSRVPVQPVALTGTHECFPPGARWPRRVLVTYTFGVPFRIAERRPDGRQVTRQEASDAIMLSIAEILPPEYRGVFSDLDQLQRRLEGVRLY
jgi:1-acyl-sn-glycerol-3-phosphate acyltransferase